MYRKSRDLAQDVTGDEIAVQHRELIRIGFGMPAQERQERHFGDGTRQAVKEFQQHALSMPRRRQRGDRRGHQ